jgi:DNA polymerase-3 subunit delta'
MTFTLTALPPEDIEQYLSKKKSEWNSRQRALVAQLCEGAVGKARSFDLETYTVARQQALVILNSAVRGSEHSELFKVTDTYRAGAEGRDKIEQLLRTMYSILQDLIRLKSGTPELVRNRDIHGELKKMADSVDFDWIAAAADRLSEVERGMRRNLLRSLSLDAFAAALENRT